jgi:multidrug efflux pump subunit AcrB
MPRWRLHQASPSFRFKWTAAPLLAAGSMSPMSKRPSQPRSGDTISEVVDGQKRYAVALRIPDRYRTDPDAMRGILLSAPGGEQVSLDQVLQS